MIGPEATHRLAPSGGTKQGVSVTVLGEYGVAGHGLATSQVGSLGAQAGQRPGLAIGAPEAPPEVLADAPVGLAVAVGGDQAALAAGPRWRDQPGSMALWASGQALARRVCT